ncbi:hypothetical protein P280DRAFT_423273 [Massarina eburnea CBS 473.64]|uniref:Small ribosomal subunit protein mS35 mitochondrial conserved domain-containing protein n=1 Tax=Massarina eburnea CBS 473.64 TaxID=1395130 RepID=A0A6A6S5I5_9PLEO|nr:hypothetical protein P280DRAFT_423273 [Massarina eburnea CBS 473.64]
MASVSRRLLFCTRRCPSRIASQYPTTPYTPQWQRSLSTTTHLRADEPPEKGSAAPTATQASEKPQNPASSKAAIELSQLVSQLKATQPEAIEEARRKGLRDIPLINNDELQTEEDFEIPDGPKNVRPGFWAEGEPDMGPDDDYYADDLTSLGHGELEKHRELREYARLIAWELPLLNQLARPYVPPTATTPFRFRYTSYLGERHPAINKVVVEFSPSDIDLLSIQRDKLIKLAGVRYNPDTDLVKLSCEKFDTQAQNKRFLGETITKLLDEAKDDKDTFADVPFDFRHHKPKVRHEFPKEWILTPERKLYLEEKRAQSLRSDDEKLNNGLLVDGKKVIETSLPYAVPTPAPAMLSGTRGKSL